jgi:Methyltransferase domain
MSTLFKPPLPESTSFDSDQYDLPYSPGVERHFWHYARSRIVERHLRSTTPQNDPGGTPVLDVGCGVGLTVNYLRRSGIDCHGVELGSPPIRPGLENFVTTGTDANDLPIEIRQRTRIILLLDVIEHIENPISFLTNLCANFPILERILITVPARMELWSNYDVYYRHFLRYDKKQMRIVAKRAGFDLVALRYFFVGLYPIALGLSHVFRHRSLATPPPTGRTAWLHRLAGLAFVIEERLPFISMLAGTSLLAVLSTRKSRPRGAK